MFRVILFISIVVSLFSSGVLLSEAAGNITESTFKIDLVTMDPIGS